MFPQGSMPRLESLFFFAQASHIACGDLDIDMRHLPSLQKVHVFLRYEESCLPAVQKAADMLELALEAHPNRLTFIWSSYPLGPQDLKEEEGPSEVVTVSNREGQPVAL